MTYDDWKANEPDDGEDKFCDEMVGLIASNDRLRALNDALLAAAKQAFCMIDKARYENTPPYNAVLAAIAAAEELAP